MKRYWILRGGKFVIFVLLAATVLSFLVMALWNWLMPALFGLHTLSFWQALGLLILSKILFRGWAPAFGLHWRHRMRDRWEQMTPEEREKFRAGMRGGCGPFGTTAESPKA